MRLRRRADGGGYDDDADAYDDHGDDGNGDDLGLAWKKFDRRRLAACFEAARKTIVGIPGQPEISSSDS